MTESSQSVGLSAESRCSVAVASHSLPYPLPPLWCSGLVLTAHLARVQRCTGWPCCLLSLQYVARGTRNCWGGRRAGTASPPVLVPSLQFIPMYIRTDESRFRTPPLLSVSPHAAGTVPQTKLSHTLALAAAEAETGLSRPSIDRAFIPVLLELMSDPGSRRGPDVPLQACRALNYFLQVCGCGVVVVVVVVRRRRGGGGMLSYCCSRGVV